MHKRIIFIILCLAVATSVYSQGREVHAFNDGWQFRKGPFPADPLLLNTYWNSPWQEVEIPHTWNAKDMQEKTNHFYAGEAYYRKLFYADKALEGKRVFLRFEGVGQVATLYVNQEMAGSHKGGYAAFAIEITNLLKYGQNNELLLKADNQSRPDVIPINHNLFGVYGGIYRPVWMVITGPVHIAVADCASPGIYITQKNVSGKGADICVKTKLENKGYSNEKVNLETTVYDIKGKQVVRKEHALLLSPAGMQQFSQEFRISTPHLWQGLKDPYLYKVITRVKKGSQILDEVVQPLGIRKYEIRAGDGFYLNGEKYPMYGVTRHQDWWGIGSALKNEHHDFDLDVILDIGATTVRFAHYQQSEYLYSRCDSLGLIIWAEIPFVNRVSGEEGENAKEQLRELIRQNFNHPSIYVWGLHNEVYQPHEYTAELTRQLHDLAKTEDPDRYTVAVNGYGHMEHPVNRNADIQGMNRYFGWYEKKIGDIKPWIEELETRFPDYKFMLTEYGADANIHHQTEYIGESLNWGGQFYPETFQTKTHEYQWGIIAKHPYIIASYLWNTFDFAVPMWKRGGVEARNLKGLVTFDRKIKKDAYFWYKANWSSQPVLYITGRRLKQREKQTTSITVYSNIGEPQVYLNGRKLEGIRKGYTDVHYILENVSLNQGENIITATAKKGDETYEDRVEWNFTSAYKAGEAKTLNSDKEHWGF